jgi:hypothetical protein
MRCVQQVAPPSLVSMPWKVEESGELHKLHMRRKMVKKAVLFYVKVLSFYYPG